MGEKWAAHVRAALDQNQVWRSNRIHRMCNGSGVDRVGRLAGLRRITVVRPHIFMMESIPMVRQLDGRLFSLDACSRTGSGFAAVQLQQSRQCVGHRVDQQLQERKKKRSWKNNQRTTNDR
jgi:hypothetical protein